jgi:hypothetical protein
MDNKPKKQKNSRKLGRFMSPVPLNSLVFRDNSHHDVTSFFGLPAMPAMPKLPGMGMMGSAPGTAGAPATQPGIDVKAEVARIEGNISLFYAGIAATAIGIGVTSCLFVRSILKPAKGFHGGSSDGDMESEEDESDDESDES